MTRHVATLGVVNVESRGAARLLTALHGAAKSFREFGYAQFMAHQSVGWDQLQRVGIGVDPLAMVGVCFDLDDAESRHVGMSVNVWLRGDAFVLEAHVTVDDPLPERWGAGNQRFLLDLPEVRTEDLDECLTVLRDYTGQLCAYTSVLDDLGVPRTA